MEQLEDISVDVFRTAQVTRELSDKTYKAMVERGILGQFMSSTYPDFFIQDELRLHKVAGYRALIKAGFQSDEISMSFDVSGRHLIFKALKKDAK
mgnify:CR=1 FL=1